MNAINHPIRTVADIVRMLDAAALPAIRRRDMLSGISRICGLLGCHPESLKLDVSDLRIRISRIRPAAHRMSNKTFSNVRCAFAAALGFAGVIDSLGRGDAKQNPAWAHLVNVIAHDKRRANGLAAFMNWSARQRIKPDQVDDVVVQRFAVWIQTRTLHPNPRDRIRDVPRIWNELRGEVAGWPMQELSAISFKAVSENIGWRDLPDSFRSDAEQYLQLRAEPDPFETDSTLPKRPLAPSTIRQEREHIRLSASLLIRQAKLPASSLASLADLICPERVKAVLRHYHNQAGGRPSRFAIALSKTLIDIARFHVKVGEDHLKELKAIGARLPVVPFDLTEKNKELLRRLENEQTRTRLVFMPDLLERKVEAELRRGLIRFVEAQVAIAVDILLVAPLRPQNLSRLNWQRHFKEPRGAKGPLVLFIPKDDTKTRRRELTFEIPEEIADRIRWYRREIMPRLGAHPCGDLFVNRSGECKHQETLTGQIVNSIADNVGIHMTPHQFRHVAAALYLEEHPEDFQTVTDLLGHAWAKTTLIYAGSSSRRASKAYGSFIIGQREALRLKRGRARRSP